MSELQNSLLIQKEKLAQFRKKYDADTKTVHELTNSINKIEYEIRQIEQKAKNEEAEKRQAELAVYEKDFRFELTEFLLGWVNERYISTVQPDKVTKKRIRKGRKWIEEEVVEKGKRVCFHDFKNMELEGEEKNRYDAISRFIDRDFYLNDDE